MVDVHAALCRGNATRHRSARRFTHLCVRKWGAAVRRGFWPEKRLSETVECETGLIRVDRLAVQLLRQLRRFSS